MPWYRTRIEAGPNISSESSGVFEERFRVGFEERRRSAR